MSPTLSEVFSKFAGKEVPAFDEANDPTIKAIRERAAGYGWSLRVVWQGMGEGEEPPKDSKRLNAYIQRESDGKWRVQKNFDLG